MTESTAEQYAASTNGRVHFDETTAEPPATPVRSRGKASMLVPVLLIVAGVIVVRHMQRGNYA
jgi:hypothetical protein